MKRNQRPTDHLVPNFEAIAKKRGISVAQAREAWGDDDSPLDELIPPEVNAAMYRVAGPPTQLES